MTPVKTILNLIMWLPWTCDSLIDTPSMLSTIFALTIHIKVVP